MRRLRARTRWLASAALAPALAHGVAPDLPDGPGRAELERACSQCHSLETVVKVGRTRAQWEAKIDSMIAKGAKLSDEEIDVVAAYLAQHFGRSDSQ